METIKIRGLLRLSSWIFAVWGTAVLFKGFYDLFLGGQPEANLYAPKPWAFVTQAQWLRYSLFESTYGLACLAVAGAVISYGHFLPETIRRKRLDPELDLFK